MKKLLQIVLFLSPLLIMAQPGIEYGQQEVSFKVRFDKAIPVTGINIYYSRMDGDSFSNIHYEIDTADNSIQITGHNEYMVGTGMPTFVFVKEEASSSKVISPTEECVIFTVTGYYLYGGWRCDMENVPEILFAKSYTNISFEGDPLKPKVHREGDDWRVKRTGAGNRMIKVNPKPKG